MKKITILFDLDGTLIDSTEAIVLSFWDVFDDFGKKRASRDTIVQYIGYTLEDMFISMDIDKDIVDKCVESYKKHYIKRALEMTKLLPNAKEAIQMAYDFARLGIVTTKTGRYSKKILDHLGIMRYFEVLIGREDVIYPKPHKEPIEKALFLMDAKKDSSWMIGDTTLDIISAKNANIKAVGVLSGYGKKDELLLHTNIIKKDSFEAIKHIAQFAI